MVWQFKWTLFDRALTVRFLCCIQLFWERLSEKNVHATIPKGNMGYDQYTVPNDCSCQTYFCCFPLALENICPWPACHSFKFLWRTVHSKPPPIPFGIVAYTFSDNLSRNSCKQVLAFESVDEILRCDHSNETSFQQSFHKVPPFITLCIYRGLSVDVSFIRKYHFSSMCCRIFHCVWNISAFAGSIHNQDCIFHFLCFIAFVHSYITIALNVNLPKITVLTSFIATTGKRLDCVCPAANLTEFGKGSLLFLVRDLMHERDTYFLNISHIIYRA